MSTVTYPLPPPSKTNPRVLGGKAWTTKIAIKNEVQRIVQNIPYDGHILPDTYEYQFFYDLLQNHPQAISKIRNGISSFCKKQITMNCNGWALVIMHPLNDGEQWPWEDSFSYSVCIDGKHKDLETLLPRVMRSTINDQIVDFKREQIVMQCVSCGSGYDPQIDHVKPFADIAKEFIELHGVDYNFAKDDQVKSNGLSADIPQYKFENTDYGNKWKQYHREHATYQVLCRNCNGKKGKRTHQPICVEPTKGKCLIVLKK
jgi:hypothetical protein